MFFGRYFGGQNGMFLALAFAAVMNFGAYFFSDKIALATYRAQPVTREELPRAYAAVERLTQKIGIPMPKIYVIPTESPNAFATGRNESEPGRLVIGHDPGQVGGGNRADVGSGRGVGQAIPRRRRPR